MKQPHGVPLRIVIPLAMAITFGVLRGLWENINSSTPPPSAPPSPAASLTVVIRATYPSVTPTPFPSGEIAPPFKLAGLDGKTYTLQDYLGKKVILNFWATWCAPCRIEMPLLQETFKRMEEDGVIGLGINAGEDAARVHRYADELGLTFPILLDPGLLTLENYKAFGLPTTLFIDTKGIIQRQVLGPLTEKSLQAHLQELSDSG